MDESVDGKLEEAVDLGYQRTGLLGSSGNEEKIRY